MPKPENTNRSQTLLDFLQVEVNNSYAESADERALLHQQEWEAAEPSILIEGELFTDTIVGAVRTMNRVHSRSKADALRSLQCSTIYASTALVDWIRTHASAYPAYVKHLQAVEHLRAVALWTWQEKGRNT